MTERANIICIKWGTLFGPEYVNRLYSGVRRNISRPVRFFCMTEHAEGLHPDIEVLPLPVEPFADRMASALAVANRQGAMRKVSLFRPGLVPDLEGPFLGFDLDVVITGSLDEIHDMAPGMVAMRQGWTEKRKGRPTGHGSVFRFDPALHGFLYEDIAKNAYREVEAMRADMADDFVRAGHDDAATEAVEAFHSIEDDVERQRRRMRNDAERLRGDARDDARSALIAFAGDRPLDAAVAAEWDASAPEVALDLPVYGALGPWEAGE